MQVWKAGFQACGSVAIYVKNLQKGNFFRIFVTKTLIVLKNFLITANIMKQIASFFVALIMPLLLWAQTPADTITIFMIGDSTMANKPIDMDKQERGWGQMLPLMLQGAIKVDNHALTGYSGKSFIDNGKWAAVLERMQPGDYLIIQFGHNDQKQKDPKRYGDVGGIYDDNLRKFINEARAKGGKPILCNSIVRRNFPADVNAAHEDRDDNPPEGFENLKTTPEGKILVDTHGEYVEAPRRIAREMGVPFIEMNMLTHNLVQGLGTEKSKELFMWIPEGKYEFCPQGKIDNTHLNIYGGTVVAGIAARAIAEAVPALRPYIKAEYIVTYPTY